MNARKRLSADQPNVQLYLLRHAHAGDPAKWKGDDALRPLSEKGRGQAERLGAFLAAREFKPGAIVTSPRLRALETAEIVGRAIDMAVEVDERLGMPLDTDGVAAIIREA